MIQDLRRRLRSETANSHARLEHALDLPGKLDDRGEAIRLLARLHGLFAGIEPNLDHILGPAVMDGRHRIEEIRHDLVAMGMGADVIADLPVLTWIPPSTADEAIGALYVLEGMRLGGRVIGRAAALQEWAPQGGLCFWSGGPAVGSNWSTFIRRLDDVGCPALAVRGAANMFATCLDWLVGHRPEGCLHGCQPDDTPPAPAVDGRVAQR